MIAVRETTQDNAYAIAWTNSDGTLKPSLNSSALSKSIYDRTGWKKEYNFKFRGITRIRGNGKIMFFYLDEPQIIPSKKVRKQLSNNNQSEQFIEYKEPVESATPTTRKKILVSETWASQGIFGISLSLRQKRDWIVHSVSEKDIQTNGIYVDNPLIGALPTQVEVSDELEKLIASM